MKSIFLICCFLLLSGSALADPVVDSLNALAWEVGHKNFERSVALTQEALARAQEIGYRDGQANSYRLLGLFYREKGLYEDAEDYFFKALDIHSAAADSLGIAKIYDHLSFLQTGMGDYQRAISYGLKAIRIVESLDLEEELDRFYLNLAIAYKRNRDIEEAFHYYRLAIKFYELKEDTFNAGNARYNLGNLFRDEGQPDSAQYYHEGALSLFESIEDSIGIGLTYIGMGTILHDRKDYPGAEHMYKKSLDINLRLQNDYYLFYSYLNLIEVYNEQKDHEQALEYCQLAEPLLDSVGSFYEQWLLATQFSATYDTLGQYQEALVYKEKAYVLRDSMFNEEKSQQIAGMQARYDNERLRRENAERAVENQKKTAQMNRAYGVAGLLLLSLLGGYWYYRYRQRTFRIITDQNDKIHQQQIDELLKSQEISFIGARLAGQELERKRIAKELHDGIGSMLVAVRWQYNHVLEALRGRGEDVSPLQKANVQLSSTYEELRKVAHNVSAGNLKKTGLLSAVSDLCTTISATGKIKANLSSFGNLAGLEEATEISLYRIIQELISNTLKHAKASKFDLQLNRLENELNLIVEDNGIGFDSSKIKDGGMGLNSIENRVQSLGGTIDIDSGKGAGTTIIINIPLQEDTTIKARLLRQ